jgi:hypothetical protein
MNGGTISWNNISNITSAPGYGVADALQDLADGKYKGTFIDGKKIISPIFYAAQNGTDYTVITDDGIKIFREASGNIPKLQLAVSEDS